MVGPPKGGVVESKLEATPNTAQFGARVPAHGEAAGRGRARVWSGATWESGSHPSPLTWHDTEHSLRVCRERGSCSSIAFCDVSVVRGPKEKKESSIQRDKKKTKKKLVIESRIDIFAALNRAYVRGVFLRDE